MMKPVDEFKQSAPQTKQSVRINNILENNKTPAINQISTTPKIKSFSSILENCSRQRWIEESAYFIAEHRGFAPGHALNDWLKAEQLYNKMLLNCFFDFAREDGEITVTGLQQLARAMGVNNAGKLYSKNELICAIQSVSNSSPCYKAQPPGKCLTRPDCLWESECQKLIAQWQT